MKNQKYWVLILEDGKPIRHQISRYNNRRDAFRDVHRFLYSAPVKNREVVVTQFLASFTTSDEQVERVKSIGKLMNQLFKRSKSK